MSSRRTPTYGLEIELFIIDSEGRLVDEAPQLLKAIEGKPVARHATKELSKCMIELTSKEAAGVDECAPGVISDLSDLHDEALKLGLRLLPLGTHPGRGMPKLHTSVWYDAKKSVLGEDVVKEGRISGFHFHYGLPEGIVDGQTNMIQRVGRSESKDTFISQYNLLTACDPAMLTFCQCSPIWMGFNWAKDCRVLVYRDLKAIKGGKVLRGIHYYLPVFGSLPEYEYTVEDLRVMAETRKAGWLKLLEQKRYPTNEIAGYPTLKFVWGPIRVNKVGTFEYRGLDMNHPEVNLSASKLIFAALDAIERLSLKALPSDIGIEEPFLREDDTLYLPPHATLEHLERQSVINGFESADVRKYCSALLDFVAGSGASLEGTEPLSQMLEDKRSVSDEILAMVRKNGYSTDEEIPEDMLDHIALYHADRFSAYLSSKR